MIKSKKSSFKKIFAPSAPNASHYMIVTPHHYLIL